MLKFLGPLLTIIEKILEWAEDYQRAKTHAENQKKRDNAYDNPGASFSEHFMRKPKDGAASQTDTEDTDTK